MFDSTQPILLNPDSVILNTNPGTGLNLYLFVNFIILLVNIGIFIYQRCESSKLRRIALKDDFWFRSIALPIVLDPLKIFSEDQTRKIRELITLMDNDAYDSYLENCQYDIYDLMNGFYVMHALSEELYNELIAELEVLEDKVAECCMNRGAIGVNPPSLFARTHTEVIIIIMRFHDRNKFA